jgi:hypothetical protein
MSPLNQVIDPGVHCGEDVMDWGQSENRRTVRHLFVVADAAAFPANGGSTMLSAFIGTMVAPGVGADDDPTFAAFPSIIYHFTAIALVSGWTALRANAKVGEETRCRA